MRELTLLAIPDCPLSAHARDLLGTLAAEGEDICQCSLIAVFGVHQSLFAYHMKKLIGAGLVRVERRHKWACYSVSTDAVQELTAWLS